MTDQYDFWKDQLDQTVHTVIDMPLRAISKERPRVGKSGHVYTPKRTKDFEKAIRQACQIAKPLTCPVKIVVFVGETPPKTWPVEKRGLALAGLIVPTRGDLDNQIKAITDGLNGVAYVDDDQISEIVARRAYYIEDRIRVTIQQTALSVVQIDHAVAALKAYNGPGTTDRGGS